MILVFVETAADGATEVSLETVTFARSLAERGPAGPVHAARRRRAAREGRRRARRLRRRRGAPRRGRRVLGLRRCGVGRRRGRRAAATPSPCSRPAPRGAWRCSRTWRARLDVAMAANVVGIGATDPLVVIRQVQGGAVLEEMRLPEQPAAAHRRRARRRGHPGRGAGRCRRARALPRGGRGRPPGPGRVAPSPRARTSPARSPRRGSWSAPAAVPGAPTGSTA